MIINLYNSAREVDKEILKDKTVLFIDTFQSSPLFITALFYGTKAIIPSPDVEMAIKVFKSYSPKDAILIGERDYEKIEGFHYEGNLLSLNKEVCEGKMIIYHQPYVCETLFLTEGAKEVYIASFLNRTKAVERLKDQEDIRIICVGLEGKRLALENFLLAGSILYQLSYKGLVMNDAANSALACFQNLRRRLKTTLTTTERAISLINKERKGEVEKSLLTDTTPILPVFSEGRIVLSEG